MSYEQFEAYEKYPIIISPNIGIPTILTLNKANYNLNWSFDFIVNIIAPDIPEEDILKSLQQNIELIPLYDLKVETKKLIRGFPILAEIQEVRKDICLILENIPINDIYDLDNDRPSYILRHNFFGKNKQLFCAGIQFSLKNHPKTIEYLQSHPFLMFDLHQSFPEAEKGVIRICYHSVVIHSDNWDNFRFVQISDLHIAKRYDEILNEISKVKDPLNFIRRENIIHRYKNPNNKLRQFIQWANRRADLGKVDIIFMTGDLIDFYLKHTYSHTEEYGLEESNWDTFLDIILNNSLFLPEEANKYDILEQEELKIPFYTILGNHDIRSYAYPLTVAGLYRIFGLNLLEASLYRDYYPKSQLKSLNVDKYCLKPYYQYINPFDDYFLKFGKHVFLLMNTRGESILNMRNLLMANPSNKGFSDSQYNFMKTITSRMMAEDGQTNNFFLTHAPMLNPIVKSIILRKILSLFKKMEFLHPNMFKERFLRKSKRSHGRADLFLNFDYGSILKNRKNTLSLMLKYNMINLCGHTHEGNESRFNFIPQESSKSKPFVIYFDDYSEEYPIEFINKHLPMVFQTPSLGVGRPHSNDKFGGYREIEIINNEIVKIRKGFLSEIVDADGNIYSI